MTGFTQECIDRLRQVSTATITTQLFKRGLRNVYIQGIARLTDPSGGNMVGPAYTMRNIPAREDLATPASWSNPISTRSAIEAMPEGCIAVVDAMGCTDAGIFGDM